MEHKHEWVEDEMFASGAVMMLTSFGGENALDLGHETKVFCKCGASDFVPKGYLNRVKLDLTKED